MECALTDGGVQYELKVFLELFETFYSTVPEHQLKVVLFQVSFLYFADYAFKMDDHDQFVLVADTSTEI